MKLVSGLICISVLLTFDSDSAFAQYGEYYNSPVPAYTPPTPVIVPFPNVIDTYSLQLSPGVIPDVMPSEPPPKDTEIFPIDNTTSPSNIPPDSFQLPPVVPIIPLYLDKTLVPTN